MIAFRDRFCREHGLDREAFLSALNALCVC
jgi:hypothetical protein